VSSPFITVSLGDLIEEVGDPSTGNVEAARHYVSS